MSHGNAPALAQPSIPPCSSSTTPRQPAVGSLLDRALSTTTPAPGTRLRYADVILGVAPATEPPRDFPPAYWRQGLPTPGMTPDHSDTEPLSLWGQYILARLQSALGV